MAEVFLAGTCGASTWRATAIEILERAGVSFYNPQLGPGEWTPEVVPVEARAKAEASCCLMVITSDTRGIASMIEATELIASGADVVLCVQDWRNSTAGAASAVDADVARGRQYVAVAARQRACPMFDTVSAAASEAARRALEARRETRARWCCF
jgi:hypothetical protein